MINPKGFYEFLKSNKINFYTGVPDSQLKNFLDYLTYSMGVCDNHVIAANEGNAVAIAAGYHLSTGRIPLVYMQNSGIGNAVNPITSLTDPKVYAIPIVYLVGWRGTPGTHDEPQHIKQGEITIELLELLGIKTFVVTKETSIEEIIEVFNGDFSKLLSEGKSIAFVIKKGAFEKVTEFKPKNDYTFIREDAVREIIKLMSVEDVIVSTTGKISREVYETREILNQDHSRDFLTVGSMGHASMIALSIAKNKISKRVWCLDGDGAVIMHLGGLATIGAKKPNNLVHIILNNNAHESVGGQPTIANDISITQIALSCGYKKVFLVKTKEELNDVLKEVKHINELVLIEILVSIYSRDDLGRPQSTPIENKEAFVKFLQ